MMGRLHTDKEYENELTRLREQLLLMGGRVEAMIAGSIRALVDRDSDLARKTIQLDRDVNRAEIDADNMCLRILARRQPVASDLRFITIALKLVTDLERMGDVCVNICERAIELNQEPPLKSLSELTHMGETIQAMAHDALDAFVAGDLDAAQAVIEKDRIVDAYYSQVFRELLVYMMEDTKNIYRAMRLQAVAKHLERIGDHATNVAEMVVFMVKGKDIRHTGRKRSSKMPSGLLFLCLKNSARSQMAEGWAKKLMPAGARVWSAAQHPGNALNPLAIEVMKEVGIDITRNRPKRIAEVPLADVDTVITLCSELPSVDLPPDARREQWDVMDPSTARGSREEQLAAFRETRDELRSRIQTLASTPNAPIE